MSFGRWLSYRSKLLRRAAVGVAAALFVIAAAVASFKFVAADTIEAVSQLGPDKSATVIFGVATVTLTFVAFLLAIISFFGWASIKDRVQEEVKLAMANERKFDLALSRFGLGAVYGCVAQAQLIGQPPGYFLEHAIWHDRKGLQDGGKEYAVLEWKLKNNLAYALALRGHEKDAEEATHCAWEAWHSPDLEAENKDPVFLTVARVAAEFAKYTEPVPLQALQLASRKLEAIYADKTIDEFTELELLDTRDRLAKAIEEARQSPVHSDEKIGALLSRLMQALRHKVSKR